MWRRQGSQFEKLVATTDYSYSPGRFFQAGQCRSRQGTRAGAATTLNSAGAGLTEGRSSPARRGEDKLTRERFSTHLQKCNLQPRHQERSCTWYCRTEVQEIYTTRRRPELRCNKSKSESDGWMGRAQWDPHCCPPPGWCMVCYVMG